MIRVNIESETVEGYVSTLRAMVAAAEAAAGVATGTAQPASLDGFETEALLAEARKRLGAEGFEVRVVKPRKGKTKDKAEATTTPASTEAEPATGPAAPKSNGAGKPAENAAAETGEAETGQAESMSYDDVHNLLNGYIKKHGIPAARKVLSNFGGSKLSEIDETKYADLAAQLEIAA